MSDEPLGDSILRGMAANLSSFGRRASRLAIRVLVHPDQFVVLNSDSASVRKTSRSILKKHALALDLLGLPRSPWSAMILHGGKSGRGDLLVRVIEGLPDSVRSRLVLENDEYSYSSEEILDVCRRAKVPMVFDAHHHVIHEKLDSYEHPSIAQDDSAIRDPRGRLRAGNSCISRTATRRSRTAITANISHPFLPHSPGFHGSRWRRGQGIRDPRAPATPSRGCGRGGKAVPHGSLLISFNHGVN